MTSLALLQRGFQRHVFESHPRFEREILGSDRLSAAQRLAIYSGAYRARLVETLGKHYPGLRALAGDQCFDHLAQRYVGTHPSSYRNLRWFGSELPAFIAEAAPARRGPALAEMAAFEWKLGLAFDATDAVSVTIDEIAEVPPSEWASMRFVPHPSIQCLALRYNIPVLHTAAQEGKPLPPLKRARSARPWLIWRQDLVTRYRSFERDEAFAFDALVRGAQFGEICAQLARAANPGMRAAQLLKAWVAEGLICGIN